MRSSAILTKIVLTLLAVALVLGGALLLARHERYAWTTDSPQALAAFEAGQEAMSKLYLQEAREHYEEALSHDPDFAAAELYLVHLLARQPGETERLGELVKDLQTMDLEGLNRREQALVSIFRARMDHDGEEVEKILDAYLERHPDDPWLLERRCSRFIETGRNDEADDCLRHLLQLDPNRVQAQNLLAYAAMNRGDFAEAESRFEVYRFLAPDQPNPHDSMGELLMVTGRYDEADEQFRRAVTMKPDFCPSWANLVNVALLRADGAAARQRLSEVEQHQGCPAEDLAMLRCKVAVWSAAGAGDWAAAWTAVEGCPLDLATAAVAGRAALESGTVDSVGALHEAVLDPQRVADRWETMPYSLGNHLDGLWHSAQGDPEAALEPLRANDRLSWGGGLGIFLLVNGNELVAALEAAGRSREAEETYRDLIEVNRPFATAPPFPPLHPLPPVPAAGDGP